jgi:CRISPR/Cas system CSM-associated protein Csm3 (group 7 of RAMP superfamily)
MNGNLSIDRYEVVLEAKSPIRVGAAEDPFRGVGNPVVRVGDRFVIPGSSLKGALRNQLERYFINEANKRGENSLKPCLAAGKPSEFERELIEDGKYARRHVCLKTKTSVICPVCYFLGAQTLLGFVRVPFLYLEDEGLQAEVLTGIAIDRKTGTARRGAKYEYEVLPEGTKFKGVLEIVKRDEQLGWEFGKPRYFMKYVKENEEEREKKYTPDKWLEEVNDFQNYDKLFGILKSCIEGIQLIGGYKSRGAGKVEIKLNERKKRKRDEVIDKV